MEMIDIPMSIIIFMPLAIVFVELLVYGISVFWKWFIGNGE